LHRSTFVALQGLVESGDGFPNTRLRPGFTGRSAVSENRSIVCPIPFSTSFVDRPPAHAERPS
jgi:hypothetical protein